MSTFTSSVWDRLIAPVPASAAERRPLQLTLAQYKRTIARDLEALLNTRVAISPEELATYPACRESSSISAWPISPSCASPVVLTGRKFATC
jgi:type VI secretion system protein ImpF